MTSPAAPVLCREEEPRERGQTNASPKLVALVARATGRDERGRSSMRWDGVEGERRASAMAKECVVSDGNSSNTWRVSALDEEWVVEIGRQAGPIMTPPDTCFAL